MTGRTWPQTTPEQRIKAGATEAAKWFEIARRATGDTATGPREDGDEYVRIKDGAPSWVQDMVRHAHGASGDDFGMLPDDWRYRFIREAVDAISSTLGEIETDAEGGSDEAADALDALSHEFADDVPTYNAERIAWLGSHGSRPGYVDEAMEGYEREIGERGVLGIIALGIYAEREEVFGQVCEFFRLLWTPDEIEKEA